MKLIKPLMFVLFAASTPAPAALFDCSVVYDEFDSLMNKQFLVEPDRYVTTVTDRLSVDEYQRLQRGQFTLFEDRLDSGIIVFRTNEQLYGKLLYRFVEAANQEIHLIIDEVVIFARVADGYGPIRFGPIRVKPGFGVDLDGGDSYVLLEEPGATPEEKEKRSHADLAFRADSETGTQVIEAVNQATLNFPVETLCHRTRHSQRGTPDTGSPSSARSMPLPPPPPASRAVPESESVRQP